MTTRPHASAVRVLDLGTLSVPEFAVVQDRAVRARITGEEAGDLLLAVRHPATVTHTRPRTPYLLRGPGDLAADGIAVHRVVRGGGTLYLGPGHLALCPVLDVARTGGPADYPDALQDIAITALRSAGLPVHPREGATGLWHGERKVAAIGVAVRRGIASYGVFLNIDADLGRCALVPRCGDACGDPGSLVGEFGSGVPAEAELIGRFAEALEALR
jgi:lipoyl(octanoyl) transferase